MMFLKLAPSETNSQGLCVFVCRFSCHSLEFCCVRESTCMNKCHTNGKTLKAGVREKQRSTAWMKYFFWSFFNVLETVTCACVLFSLESLVKRPFKYRTLN